MSGSVSGEIKAEPNLTPLLDVVFQLITFFMLVINFSSDTYDQRVRLPVAASATAPQASSEEHRLVFNINSDGEMLVNGEALDPERAVKEIKVQSQLERSAAERQAKKRGEKFDETNLPVTVVIRCDRATPYTQVYRYITACQNYGFRKFALKAMNGEG